MVGDIVAGRLNNGERVTVYGSKSIGGPFMARKIVKSNSNMNVQLRNAMPAFIVRIITLALIAVIVGIVMQFTGGNPSGGNTVVDGGNTNGSATNTSGSSTGGLFNAALWKQILAGAIVILTLVFGGKIRNMTGLSIKVLWIIVAVLVGLLVPEIGASIVMICVIIWAIKLMIRGFR